MGAFIVNFNVRSQDKPAVERAVRALQPSAAWITAPENGWITIYEKRASKQEDSWIRDMTERLSAALAAPAISFLVHDSDILCYWLCDNGEVIDEYNSRPNYFSDVDSDSGPEGGRPDLFVRYCANGTSVADVQRVLAERDDIVLEDQRLEEFSELLGIDPLRLGTDFHSIGGEMDPSELAATFIGNSSRPGAQKGGEFRPRLAIFDEDAAGDDDEDEDVDE